MHRVILYQAQILYVSDRITQTNPIRREGILATSEDADDDEAKYRTAWALKLILW